MDINRITFVTVFILLYSFFYGGLLPAAAAPFGDSPFDVTIKPSTLSAAPGADYPITVSFTIPGGHKLYRESLSVTLESPGGLVLSGSRLPGDPDHNELKGDQQAVCTITIPGSPRPGATLIGALKVTLQGCTDDTCFPSETKTFPLTVEVADAPAPGDAAGPVQPSANTGGDLSGGTFVNRLKSSGWLVMLGAVYLAGLALSLTPCVYPMLIITLTIVGAHGENKSPARGFLLSAVYVLGIAVTFSALGIAAAAAGSLFGAWMQNPYAMGTLAVVFFVLALGMFDVYQFSSSQGLSGKLSKLSGKGLIGVLLMGLVSGLVLSPCTGPVLVGLLAYIAETGRMFYGFTLLFAMALGMGTLMILAGTFAGLAQKLPRAGMWMITVRNIFGVILLGMALYYARMALPGLVWLILAGAVSTGLGVGLRTLLPADKPGKFKYVVIATTGLVLITVGLTIIGTTVFSVLFDRSLLTGTGSPAVVSAAPVAAEKLPWTTSIGGARSSGKPVLVDVYADWCASCKQLERETFTDPEVRGKLAAFSLVKVDITEYDGEAKAALDELWKTFDITGPHTAPKLLFFNKSGEPLPGLTISGFVPPEQFLAVVGKIEN